MKLRYLVFLTFLSFSWAAEIDPDVLRETIEHLYNDYNRNSRPSTADGEALNITVDVYVNSISSISENTMDFKLNMYIRQRWRDPRLASTNFSSEGVLINTKTDQTWLPDLHIVNDKDSTKSDVVVLNSFLRVNTQGDLLYSVRVSSTVACDMQLARYPFDVQRCSLQLGSYGHFTSELRLLWNVDDAIQRNEGIQLPEHVIDGVHLTNCTRDYNIGWFSCISAEFVFRRNINFCVVALFIPSVLIVVLSWVAFWIDKSSTPGRVSLSVITILTMQNQMSVTMTQLPKVSYIKLLDAWMTGCMVFVFAGFLEFALVNQLALHDSKQRGKLLLQEMSSSTDQCNGLNQKLDIAESLPQGAHPVLSSNRPMGVIRRRSRTETPCQEMSTADKVDYYCRIIFPLSFLIFNLIFWLCYQTWK